LTFSIANHVEVLKAKH